MSIDNSYYDINGMQIAWGKPLHEVRQLLRPFEEFKPYGGWPNRRGKCTSIFALAASEFEVRAPYEDRPVMQVIYQIAPIASENAQIPHLPYLKQLEQVLGSASKTENLYHQVDLANDYASSSVVFSAKWLFNGVRISLSVYGGTRNNEGRLSAAGIFIDWLDEVKAAEPFRVIASKFEKELSEQINAGVELTKFKLLHSQSAYRMVHYEWTDPYLAEKDSELRAAQLALYKKELYQAPALIRAQLKADEIGYYKVADSSKIFISNQWDTVVLSADQSNEMSYWDILPARGSGYKELLLNELRITDDRNSLALLAIVEQIETDLGQKIKRQEAYDD